MSMDPTGGTGTTQRIPPTPPTRRATRGGPNAGVITPHGRPGVYIYPFWQRSEFWALFIPSVLIGIAAIADDTFGARSAWLYITILSAAYILSRGLAKREPREDDADQAWTPGDDDDDGLGGRFTR